MMDSFAVKTYRYLRISMIAVIVMLIASVIIEWVNTKSGCLQGSISAYYYTPVQSIFVGALITIGVCMIALRGTTDWEDTLMNLGGMLAPVVALVPTPGPGGCRSVGEALSAAPENIQNNVLALFVAGIIALVAGAFTLRGQDATPPTTAQRLGMIAAVVIFLGGVGWFVLDRAAFDRNAHYTAAITLFACIVVVVILNSRRQAEEQPGERKWAPGYLVIAALMVASSVVIVAITLITGWEHGILVVEAALIILFAIFWAYQTKERWNAS
ncbi:MAG: hypothetical protein WBA97_15165 [Actinophytocola sp.]|uniref:hypothetical protein n=1 Tax=Actinophytocola sp. TaxID=1872138 RepID=UPI003C741119